MSRPTIIINDLDAERIDRLLEQPAFAGLPIADALNAELDRAQMCSPETMPHDVVTMNSRVKFRNLSDGEVRVRTPVYPANMTDSSTQLSVMAPVGAALLGLRVGDTIHWELPCGPQHTSKSLSLSTNLKLRATTCANSVLSKPLALSYRGCIRILFPVSPNS